MFGELSETLEPEQRGDSLVRFTVKELLSQMFSKLDSIEKKLETKVDLSDLLLIERRLDHLESDVRPLVSYVPLRDRQNAEMADMKMVVGEMRITMATQDQLRTSRRWVWGVGVPGAIGGVLALLNFIFVLGRTAG